MASDAERLVWALKALDRLADPTEIAGFGDATESNNDSPEMRARLAYAKRWRQAIREDHEPT